MGMNIEDSLDLFEQILRQAKEDYIDAYKVICKYTNSYSPNVERVKSDILRLSKKYSDKMDLLQDCRKELTRIGDPTTEEMEIWKANGKKPEDKPQNKYQDAINALIEENKFYRNKYNAMTEPWDSIMMMDSVMKYMDSSIPQMFLDVKSEDVAMEWQKYARKELKEAKETVGKKKPTNKKLTKEQVNRIYELHDQGLSIKEIAKK